MPKRDVTVISHSVLTNHRIVAEAEEPFPDVAFHMTTPQLPDLVHLTADPAKQDVPPPVTLLEAYNQVMLSHPEYRTRYWALARQLKDAQPENVHVLEALADESVQKKSAEGASLAIQYLQKAILYNATNPADFEELAELLVAANRQSEAVNIVRHGIHLDPYDAELYRLGTRIYVALNQMHEACQLAAEARQRFPQDDAIRGFMKRCETATPGASN
jgi:tetratricopeptide (TPR) repeat protein